MSANLNAFEALALVPGWDPGDADIEELKGGLTNRTFLVSKSGESCVLRINAAESATIAPDRRCEVEIMKNAARAGIAPGLVHADEENGILLTEYLPGKTWGVDELNSAENLAALAGLLRKLHELPHCGTQLDLHASALRYESYLEKRRGLHTFASRCVEVIAAVPPTDSPVCCHNDIVADNIIEGDSLQLIDWEYARDNDPFFDLASLVCFHNIDDKGTQYLLDAYTGGSTPEQRARLAELMHAFDAVQWLWLASRHLNQPGQENVIRLEELRQRIG